MTTNTDLSAMMGRIQSLIAKADASTFPEEQAAFYAKAEELMRKYRIAEEDLIATDVSAVVPVMHSIFVADYATRFTTEYHRMLSYIVNHADCMGIFRWVNQREAEAMGGVAGLWMDVFGYEGDLRMIEWLWSSARIIFGTHLEPQVNPALSDQVNAYNLRQAGVLRKDIAIKLWGDNTPALRSRAQRLYVAECIARNEEPALTGLGTDATAYRAGYAEGFVSRLYDRLRASRDAADASGGALVFAGRTERIAEVMYATYPHLRPADRSTDVAVAEESCKACEKAKSGHCRQHPGYRWSAADERRWQRANGAAANAGKRTGATAAGKVEMSRPTTARVDAPRTIRGELS